MKKIFVNIILFFTVLLVCLLLTEVVLRIIVPERIRVGELYQKSWNRDIHISPMLPDAEVIQCGIPVKINSLGLRDKEYPLEKPEDVYRIQLYGDSFTYGYRLPLKETLPKQLETKLNLILDDSVETLNFGVSGFNTFQEMMFFAKFGQKFDPDLVILVWCANDNDLNEYNLSDLSYFLEHQTVLEPTKREDGSVVLGHAVVADRNNPIQISSRQVEKSYLHDTLYWFYQMILEKFYIVNVFGGRVRNLLFKLGLNLNVWENEVNFDTNREGFRLSFLSIKEMNRICSLADRQFVVVIYPRLQLLKVEYYNDRLYKLVQEFCNNNNILCVNMFDSFRGRNPNRLRVALEDSHPNSLANSIASDTLASFLESIIAGHFREKFRSEPD